MLCTHSKLVYTFTLRYNLASRAFPKATTYVVCTEFPVGSGNRIFHSLY